ncbi:hypothetical protein FOMPIDRAFT_1061473 [Fomitopsis schrenkii]|uniref:Uncharacterized protein n=1 Tax=Fomitopsis schrenkii TaxID=2126942 RepID=S8E3Z8_FOMSC|nr:hypothetical protein FOMPIDRAFT_1061473 [Fomitopsis schrenkii]
MRLLNCLPWAVLVATASLVTAHPVGNDVFAYVLIFIPSQYDLNDVRSSSRDDADASLLVRDPTGLDLLAREYLSALLFARTLPLEHVQFRREAPYYKALRGWKLHDDMEHTRQKYHPGPRPRREQFTSQREYDKAWGRWDAQRRKFDHEEYKVRKKHEIQMGIDRSERHRQARKKKAAEQAALVKARKKVAAETAAAEKARKKATAEKEKKPGMLAKWFGRGQKKAKRGLMYVYDE